jgi:hypothetical protein
MSTNSGDSERGGATRSKAITEIIRAVASLVTSAAAIGTTFLNYQSLKTQEATKAKVILFTIPGGLDYIGSRDLYELRGTVTNVGDKIARGCRAVYQGVNDNFMPRRYLTTVLEPGPFWNLKPGENHTSKHRIPLRKADYRQNHIYIEFLMFECVTDDAYTYSQIFIESISENTWLSMSPSRAMSLVQRQEDRGRN